MQKQSRKDMPLITVITVAFNAGKHIEKTIQSVVHQDYGNAEYIVIDGGSTDNTQDLIRKHEDRIDCWISEPDDGISDAMNKGLKRSNGDLIAFLHADDFFTSPSVLSCVGSEYLRHPDVLWMTGGINIVDGNGKILEEIRPRKYSYRRLIRGNILLHPATFVTRKAFDKVGGFNTDYRYAMDYDLWLRLGGVADPLVLDRQVACFRAHPESRSIARSDLAYDESWRIRKKFLHGQPGRLLFHYLYYAACRRFVRAYYRRLLSGNRPSR